jgi:hypothetical protein
MLLMSGCRLYEPPRYERLKLAPGQPTLRVLMIGDSLTYYNDLPGLVQQLSSGEAKPIYVEQVTTPNTSLKMHWNVGPAKSRIQDGHWDEVILQDFSRTAVTDPDECREYFRLFNDLIVRSGAKTMIFENWTWRDKPDEYDALYATYAQIRDETHASLAPIGEAWRICRSAHPEIELFIDDRHPTDAGTYLTACVLYDVLYRKKSSALPMELRGPELSREVKTALRQVADQTVFPAQ